MTHGIEYSLFAIYGSGKYLTLILTHYLPLLRFTFPKYALK